MDGPNHIPRESFGSLADEMADTERSEVMQLRLENRKLRAHLDSTEKYGIFLQYSFLVRTQQHVLQLDGCVS